MHIAYISAEFPHKNLPSAGGIGSFVKTMADSLVANGHQVTVFLCLQDKNKVWKDGDINMVSIKRNSLPKVSAVMDRFLIAKRVREFVKTSKIDLIEAPDWEGLHAFLNLNIPVVSRIHGSVSYFNKIQGVKIPKTLFWFEKKALQLSKSIVAVSDFSGKYTNQVFNSNFNYKVIYNGVNLKKFKKIKLNLENKTLLYFGTLVRKKGVLDLPIIFNKIIEKDSDFNLLIIGKDTIDSCTKGSTKEMIKNALSKEAFLKVRFLSHVNQTELTDYLSLASICLFPSKAETFGLVTIEAMAMGIPVVLYDKPWVREIVNHNEDGFYFDENDLENFVVNILDLFHDLSKIKRVSLASSKKVESKFNQEHLVLKNLFYYQSLLKC